MKKYRRHLMAFALIAAAATAVAWLAAPPSPTAVGRQRYAALRVGMPEGEAFAALGGPPRYRDHLYGQWYDELHWYATIHPRDCPDPGPGQVLYDWYQWDFGRRSASG